MNSTSRAAVDLLVVSITCFASVLAARPIVDALPVEPVGTRVYVLLLLQFVAAGAAPIALVAVRRQPLGSYGLSATYLGRSLVLGAALAVAYLAAVSLARGALVVVPFGRHGVLRLAANLPGASGLIAPALVVLVWGVVEGFFGVYFAANAGKIASARGLPRAAGALAFGAFNGLLHLAVGQGWTGVWTSVLSGTFVGLVPTLTGNAWGGVLIQVLTNAAGPVRSS